MKKIKSWIKEHRKDIIIGVICTIITSGLYEFGNWIKDVAPTAGNSLWKFLSNSFFVSVAKTTETSLISFLFSVLIGMAIAYVIHIVTDAFKSVKILIQGSERLIKEMNFDNNENADNVEKEDCAEKNIGDSIQKKANIVIKEGKRTQKILSIVVVVLFVYFGGIFAFNIFPHAVWTEYQRDLIKIAPYIEQHELDTIKSDWVCMQSKEDYDDIYKRINEIKEAHDLP